MKKTFVILMLVIFVFTNTELHQLLRFPTLFHHFLDHKKSDHEISFVEFFKKHYTENAENKTHDHNNEHSHLPFKSHDCSSVHSWVNFLEPSVFCFTYQCFISDQEKITYGDFSHSSAFLSSIWQPPKTM